MPEPQDIAALRETAERATPGPWVSRPAGKFYGPDGRASGRDILGDLSDPVCPHQVTHVAPWGRGLADAEFIAATSPDVVLALLSEVERGRALRAAVEALAEALRDAFCDCPGYRLADDQHAPACTGLEVAGAARTFLAAHVPSLLLDGGAGEGDR